MRGQTNKKVLQHETQRKLRRNMTDAELRLWRCLRGRQITGFKFRRQHPFEDYILDFVCLEAMLVIEVDGGQHALNATADNARTKNLNGAGFRVLRFWNNEILWEIEAVRESIWKALKDNPSPPQSSP
jgi:very-short-patch-repair endonuclease